MISIVIIVKNDRAIEETLDELYLIDLPGQTEIVVIDSSTQSLADIKSRFPKVNWLQFVNKTKKKYTIPAQRNMGIASAQGNIIAFIDANCKVDKKWLTELTKPILKGKENVTVGLTKSISDPSDKAHWSKIPGGNNYLDESGSNSLCFKKEIVDVVGNFDEKFDYGSDVDFSWRLIDHGYRIKFVPSAVNFHDFGTAKEDLKRSYLYGQARARLYLKHKKCKKLIMNDSIVWFYPLFIILLPITIIIPFYPLLLIIPIYRNRSYQNPLKVVYKHLVYGWGVITGSIKYINEQIN